MNDQPSHADTKPYPLFAAGGFFDMETYRGNIRGVIFSILSTAFIWYFDDVYALAHQLLGFDYKINKAKQEWTRLCGCMLGAVNLALSLFNLLQVFLKHRNTNQATRD